MDLAGRKALISGGAGHIGRATAETLVELGAEVLLLDRNHSQAQETVDALHLRRSGCAQLVDCDFLAPEAQVRADIRRAVALIGGVDILIHAAAFVATTDRSGWSVSFEHQSVGALEAALRTNVTAAFVLVQECAPFLARSGHGSVLLISSIYGLVGPQMGLYEGTKMANPVGYGATKGGLNQLGRYLATILAPAIRVNVLSPGGVWRNQPEVFHDRYVSRTPLGRMATEEDLKGAIAYLSSDLSAYVTGHNLVVDGGWTTW